MTVWQQTLPEADDAVAPVVLVVEDEVLVRLSAAQHLRQSGCEVLEAMNAEEALRLLETVDVDVAFSDVTMPGTIDGLALVDWLHKHRPHVGTIVTSGAQQPAAGYGMFLSKPYRLIDLDFCLAKVLQRQTARPVRLRLAPQTLCAD
jgi:CheY-like chemotaxis protein